MKYNVKTLKEKAIEAIKEYNLFTVGDLCARMGIAKSTYYKYFKVGDDNFNEIREMLEGNRILMEVRFQIEIFKALMSDTERKKIQREILRAVI